MSKYRPSHLFVFCMMAAAVMRSGMAQASPDLLFAPADTSGIRSFSITNAQLQGGVNFDRDNKADIAVYHPAAGNWYVRQSSDGQMMNGGAIQFGWNAALPVPGDYDGDGRTDIAVYYPGAGNWYIRRSSDGQMMNGGAIQLGSSAAIPVPGDYDGDGQTDIAVYDPQTGNWYIRQSSDGQIMNGGAIQFGPGAAMAAPGDYDGDGKTDIAVYDTKTGNWYIRRSSDGQIMNGGAIQFGWNAAMPVSAQYQINRLYGFVNDPTLVAAFGDSITAGIDGSPSYAPILAGMINKDVRKFGYPGQESYFGLDYIGDILAIRPGFVLVFFGANDAIGHDDVNDTIANLRAMVVACKNNQTIPVLTTLTPMYGSHGIFNDGVNALNPMIRDLAAEQNVPLADLSARFAGHPEYMIYDGLHPNQAGAEVIARTYADLFLTGALSSKH